MKFYFTTFFCIICFMSCDKNPTSPPSPQPHGIQGAINQASDGDTVWIAPGTYKGEGNKTIKIQVERLF